MKKNNFNARDMKTIEKIIENAEKCLKNSD